MDDEELKRLLDASAAENRQHFDTTVDRHTAETKLLFEASTAETKRHFDASTAETQRLFEASTAETKRHFDASTAETQRLFETSTAETKRHFDVVTEHLEKKFDALAETVAYVDQKIDRESHSIRAEMRKGFAETQAMIKFSHAELDRRLRTVENGLSVLQTRVERLEGDRTP